MSIFPFPLLLGEATLTVILSTHQVPLETEDRCVIATYSLLPAYLHTHTHCSNLASLVSPGTELTLKDGSFNGYATMDYVA